MQRNAGSALAKTKAAPRKKAARVRDDLVRAGVRLMLSRGYGPTSVDEVCAAAAVSKGAFFHYFSDKEALAEEVLDLYAANVLARLEEVRDSEPSGPRRLRAEIRYLVDAAETGPLRHGCLLGSFAQDLSRSHPLLRARCAHHFDRFVAWFARELFDASGGRLSRSETRGRAEQLIAGLEGALIISKATEGPGAVRRVLLRAEHDALTAIAASASPPAGRRKKRRPS